MEHIKLLYNNILLREPDEEGLKFYYNKLSNEADSLDNIKNYLRPPYSHNYLGTTIHAPSTEASLGVQIVSSLCFTKLSLVPKNNLQISH